MPYIVQAEEGEISLGLLQDLAEILLAGSTDLTYADATYRVRSARGLLPVQEGAEADRICREFNQRGFRCFVAEKLLEPPRPEHLNLERPEIEGEVELVIAGRLHLVTERVVRSMGRPRLSIPAILTGLPLPTARMEETTVEESDTRYYLDLFTSARHWRARPGTPLPIQDLLPKVVTPDTFLGAGARSLLQGDKGIRTFENENDYGKYVTWLYQVRYVERVGE